MRITGIGARKSPSEALHRVKSIVEYLAPYKPELYSGGATGMDQEWEIQFNRNKLRSYIFYPRKSFVKNKFLVSGKKQSRSYGLTDKVWKEARTIASRYHPKWNSLSPFIKNLMTRNVFQLLNRLTLEPITDCVICWTPDGANGTTIKTGASTGGTGLAIRIAADYDIPVFNLKSMSNEQLFNELEKLCL